MSLPLFDDLLPVRRCATCQREKFDDEFYRANRHHCKECCRRARRIYQDTHRAELQPKWRANTQLYKRQHRDKCAAHCAVSRAIKAGRLVRPVRCSRCASVAKIEAHHARGYAPAHWLDVTWLCRSCHVLLDQRSAHARGPLRGVSQEVA